MKSEFSSGLLIGCVAALILGAVGQARGEERPNLVVIVADDLGWNDLGYHNPQIETPHLDRLAAEGVRLAHFYVYPTCSPTRVCLLAGRNPSRFGVHGPIGGKSSQHLPMDTVTLPAALKTAGYSTHLVGKWHLGLRPEYGPTKYGFDTSYGYLHGQVDPYTHRYKFGDRTWHRNDQFIDEEGHATDLITREAVRVIEKKNDQPFFLYVAYSVPHYPLNEPQEWRDRYEGKFDDPWREHNAASITHMDDGIGQIVAALDRAGAREKTLIVFLSDNGGQQSWTGVENQYEGRYEPHTTLGDNRPLRGWKGQLYEGGIRVPALMNWRGKLSGGQVEDAVLHALDLMPTACRLAGVQVQGAWRLEGRDVWLAIAGDASPEPHAFYWNTGGQRAVRVGDWKLITDRRGENPQLFNLAEDPYEKNELAEKYPEKVKTLKIELDHQQAQDQ